MQSAVLAAALAVLSLGASAAPITALAQIDLSPPTISVSTADACSVPTEPPPQPPAWAPKVAPLEFDGSVPPLRSPAGLVMVELAEPPAILSALGGLALTITFRRRPRRRSRRKLQLRQLATI